MSAMFTDVSASQKHYPTEGLIFFPSLEMGSLVKFKTIVSYNSLLSLLMQ